MPASITASAPITIDDILKSLGIGSLAENRNTTQAIDMTMTKAITTPSMIAFSCLPEDSILIAERNNTDSNSSEERN